MSVAISVDQRAAREFQEHVLQRGPSHERGDRLEAHRVHLAERRLAVVGIQQDAVWKHLDPLAQLRRAEPMRRPPSGY